jgi:hypothetical protein
LSSLEDDHGLLIVTHRIEKKHDFSEEEEALVKPARNPLPSQ